MYEKQRFRGFMCARLAMAQYNPASVSSIFTYYLFFMYYLFLIKQCGTCASYMDAIEPITHTKHTHTYTHNACRLCRFRFSISHTMYYCCCCCCYDQLRAYISIASPMGSRLYLHRFYFLHCSSLSAYNSIMQLAVNEQHIHMSHTDATNQQ